MPIFVIAILYVKFSLQWSAFLAQRASDLWSVVHQRGLLVCTLFVTVIFLLKYIMLIFHIMSCFTSYNFYLFYAAEKLWSGLENFVFDWLINADR
jgi:amino acid transporter